MPDYGAMERRAPETIGLLEEANAVNDDSVEIGNATLGRMREQRETLEQASNTAEDTRRITGEARMTMRDMAFKILSEKLVLGSIILILLAVDGGLAYLLAENGGKLTGR